MCNPYQNSIYTYKVAIIIDMMPTETATKVFYEKSCSWKNSQYSGESTFLIKSLAHNFIEKWQQRRCFPVNIAKCLRTSILENGCEWQLQYQEPNKTRTYNIAFPTWNIEMNNLYKSGLGQLQVIFVLTEANKGENFENIASLFSSV